MTAHRVISLRLCDGCIIPRHQTRTCPSFQGKKQEDDKEMGSLKTKWLYHSDLYINQSVAAYHHSPQLQISG